MDSSELPKILDFLKNAERLKDTLRSGYTTQGRKESVAEHTWRLCLFATLVHNQYFPHLDFQKLLKMCLIHDLGEAIHGDIPAPNQVGKTPKSALEEEDLKKVLDPLPGQMKEEFLQLWWDYENAESEEAKLAKALDKLETILQHNQGKNPNDFDYAFNLDYGKDYTYLPGPITELRKLIDDETLKNHKSQITNHKSQITNHKTQIINKKQPPNNK